MPDFEYLFYLSDQHHVIDHTSGQSEEASTRNTRIEAGRIARGPVLALSDLNIEDVDAVVFPGGFGAAKNLSSFAHSAEPSVDGEVARVIRECLEAAKPMALCCIAPILLALVLCKEDGCIISILKTPAHFLTPARRTRVPYFQSPLQSPCHIQLMEKGIWHSLVGKSD